MFYPNDSIRLVRPIPGIETSAEGHVEAVICDNAGVPSDLQARFYVSSGATSVTVPPDAVELVISRSTQQRTAVIWGIEVPSRRLIETAMHSMLDCGFVLREGLNLAQLLYDPGERWWKWGDTIRDPAGAESVFSGASWDGAVVAFAGPERFQLEFRLKSHNGASLLLHEREAAYDQQVRDFAAATSLAHVLLNISHAVGAQFCAFPVADAWLMDENWGSLLRAPWYPDFLLLPNAAFPRDYPESFRVARIKEDEVMLTALPMKFAPGDDALHPDERAVKIEALRKCHALGEKYYDQMYETRFGGNGLYSSVKDAFLDAISLANQLGLKEEAGKLEDRLQHIKAVFRSQFS